MMRRKLRNARLESRPANASHRRDTRDQGYLDAFARGHHLQGSNR